MAKYKLIKPLPDFNKATSAEPTVGLIGQVFGSDRKRVPESMVKTHLPVTFKAKDLGYEESDEDGDILFLVPKTCLEKFDDSLGKESRG